MLRKASLDFTEKNFYALFCFTSGVESVRNFSIKCLWFLPLACCSLLQCEEVMPTQTHRVFQFENEHVRVWKTVIMPHQPLNMHRHDCARVVVGLKGGMLTKIEETGETSDLKFDTGVAYWLTEDAPGTLHGDITNPMSPLK
jgi:hypothetical protein